MTRLTGTVPPHFNVKCEIMPFSGDPDSERMSRLAPGYETKLHCDHKGDGETGRERAKSKESPTADDERYSKQENPTRPKDFASLQTCDENSSQSQFSLGIRSDPCERAWERLRKSKRFNTDALQSWMRLAMNSTSSLLPASNWRRR